MIQNDIDLWYQKSFQHKYVPNLYAENMKKGSFTIRKNVQLKVKSEIQIIKIPIASHYRKILK